MKNEIVKYKSDSLVLSGLNKDLLFVEISKNINRDNTNKTYKIYLEQYFTYCDEVNMKNDSQISLLAFIHELNKQDKKIQTLKIAYYSRLPYFKRNKLHCDAYIFTDYFRGLSNLKVKTESIKKKTRAITLDMLLSEIDKFKEIYKLLLLLLYFGAFRVSELLNIRFKDVEINGKGLYLTLRAAKNLKAGKEHVKFIPYSGSKLCVASLLVDYMKANDKKNNDILFENINRNQLSMFVSRKFKGYSAHSLRAGFITDSINNGQSLEQICKQTGQTVATAQTYIDNIDVDRNNAVNSVMDKIKGYAKKL